MARGRKTGGRAEGVKNKATIEKELLLQRLVAAQGTQPGKKLAREVLDDLMHLSLGLAAMYQPLPPGVVAAPHQTPNEDKFQTYANMAGDFAAKLAPYQSPKLKAVLISQEPRPGADMEGAQIGKAPPAQPGQLSKMTAVQAYRLLRDMDVIDVDVQTTRPSVVKKRA